MDRLGDDPEGIAVLEVLGLGGAGKTRLLSQLQIDASEKKGRGSQHVVEVSLEAERFATAAGPLRSLREQLSIDCHLFDTALLAYWRATGQPFQVERTSRLARSPVLEGLDIDTSVAELPLKFAMSVSLPARFAVAVYDALSREVVKLRYYDREEFKEIDDLGRNSEALRDRLPQYLALDIQRRLESSNDALIAFYDGYEKQAQETLAGDAGWLREFIGTLDRGLHVISSREPLGWPAEWEKIVQDVPVDSLPEEQARELLCGRFGKLPPEIEHHILKASERIPLLLTAIGETYEHLSSENEHVEARRLAMTLAAVQVFDESLFRYLVHELRLPVDVFEFTPFTKRFFVEKIALEPHRLYKTHDLLTTSVRSSRDAQIRRASLELATRHLLSRCQDSGARSHEVVLAFFFALVAGWQATDEMPRQSVEQLVDAGYLLYDAGYWNELASIVPKESPASEHPVTAICDLFAALAARRVVGIDSARERFARLEARASVLGRHERSVELELAYLTELTGDYATARDDFRRLNELTTHHDEFDPTDRTHMRARLWHADMLIMDGELKDGSRLLSEAYEALGKGIPMDWAELARHRGHALRFSFLLEPAEALYLEAIRTVAGVRALEGKLQTNLAETYCWWDPERALNAAKRSTEINLDLGSKIELAKCETARAIALAKMDDLHAARCAITKAVGYARAVGYRAGIAFALQAEAVVEGLLGDTDRLVAANARLSDAVAVLGTYGHLRMVPAWLMEDQWAYAEATVEVDWLGDDPLEDRLRAYLKPEAPTTFLEEGT
jgi:hypothetical protein